MPEDTGEQTVHDGNHAAFLSYASEDSKAVGRISEALRAAGIEVWFDRSELRGGDVWDQTIRQRIRDCRLFMPIISAHTEARNEGYFRREWKLAVDRTEDMAGDVAFLIPVVIDATPSTTARVPPNFREVQWSRLPQGTTSEAFVDRIRGLLWSDASSPRSQVDPHVNSGPTATRLAAATPAGESRRRVSLRIVAALTTVALLILGLSYFAVDRLVLSKHTTPEEAAASEKSIAVLPFADLSEKHDQEYLAAGVAEQVADQLSKSPGLRVIGRASTSRVNGQDEDPRSVGTRLGAGYLVQGSIRRVGPRLRVTAQLVDTRDGRQRWSESFDRTADDVLAVQDAIAAELARALDIHVTGGFESRLSVKDPAAYDLYLRGMHALDLVSQADLEEAIADFQQALRLDPTFSQAYVGLAMAYWYSGEQDWIPPQPSMEGARQAATSALRLDPGLGSAHAALAEVHLLYDRDWSAADREVEQALRLGAGTEGFKAEARLAAVKGDWDRAVRALKSGLAIDPLNPTLHWNLAYDVYRRAGRFAEQEAAVRRVLEISPHFASAQFELSVSLLLQNRYEEALTAIQQAAPDDSRLEGLALVYHAMGRKSESDAALKGAIVADAASWPLGIAEVYAFRHEPDAALAWLEKAFVARDTGLYTIKGDPLLKSLEGDPRYGAFLRKMNLPE